MNFPARVSGAAAMRVGNEDVRGVRAGQARAMTVPDGIIAHCQCALEALSTRSQPSVAQSDYDPGRIQVARTQAYTTAMAETGCTTEQFFGPVYPDYWMSLATRGLGLLLFLFYIYCLVRLSREQPTPPMPKRVQFILGFWAIGPPLWFAAEYFLVNGWLRSSFYPHVRLPCPESLKYSQELASKVWVAAVALLIAVYQKKVPGAPAH